MVLSRGNPCSWRRSSGISFALTSQTKVREVSNVLQYMYSGYIRIVQIEEERVWIFSAEICTLNVHPRRISVSFVDIPLWSCFVLLSWCIFFQFNIAIPFYSVMIVTPVYLFFGSELSVLRVELCLWFQLWNSTFVSEL